jgi:hypothetical protein
MINRLSFHAEMQRAELESPRKRVFLKMAVYITEKNRIRIDAKFRATALR